MPKKRPVTPAARSVNTDTVEFSVGSDESAPDGGAAIPPRDPNKPLPERTSPHDQVRRLNELPMRTRAQEYRSKPLDPYLIYEPENSLIRRVEVSKWDSRFNFYENFQSDVKRLWSRGAAPSEHVSFFSYVPQYSQLKYAQLKWYLWWRENVRRGVYLRTDFCYILLYIYEIINCPDLITPEKGLDLLCDIWLNYRDEHRRIDSYMCDWLCDYCLINKLPCPAKRLEPIIGDIVAAANFKEFYIGSGSGNVAASILAYSSTYDWRKSRYVTSENVELFASHIRSAFEKAYREVLSEKDDSFAKEFRVERSAYDGALCVYNMKRTITVEYASYTRSPKFRFVVTDIIKYSENRIRMALGIKSRLKVDSLTDKLKSCLDEYFNIHMPIPKKSRASKSAAFTPEVNEYDKLYEPTSTTLSLENALKIEQNSWNTTDILTSAFEVSSTEEKVPELISQPISETDTTPEPAFTSDTSINAPVSDDDDEFAALVDALDDTAREALTQLSNGDNRAVSKAAAKAGVLADALADKINETAFDIIGDSVIESDGSGYRFISDYEGDLIKWLK
ncbi:MAG: TerB N-terminal domain-containing protein [Clostridia bacterium]|nr:TerB N-terminal domain-containing protein [Clostridia bacterium]